MPRPSRPTSEHYVWSISTARTLGDAGQARSTTQCGMHGARKLHGAKPRHRRDGRAQSHTQRSNLPGASAAGAACAKAADLFAGVSDLGVAIDGWMAGMYPRRPMLDPKLERIGIGYARHPDGMLTAALRFENARAGAAPGPSRILRTSKQTFRWTTAQSTPTRSPTMAPGAIP